MQIFSQKGWSNSINFITIWFKELLKDDLLCHYKLVAESVEEICSEMSETFFPAEKSE